MFMSAKATDEKMEVVMRYAGGDSFEKSVAYLDLTLMEKNYDKK